MATPHRHDDPHEGERDGDDPERTPVPPLRGPAVGRPPPRVSAAHASIATPAGARSGPLQAPPSDCPARGRFSLPGLDVALAHPHRDREAVRRRRYDVDSSDGATMSFERIGVARFALAGEPCELELYWLVAYGGGLFVPFADATAGDETYGAGRYLLDTVKGADLGARDGGLVLDFNLAYNPSCSYDPRWVCPLSPPENRLPVAVRAGEQHRS